MKTSSALPATAALVLALLSCTAQAHFHLLEPAPIHSFVEDVEPNAPCGGFSPDFSTDNVTNFHVGGDAVLTELEHPQAGFIYRGTLDTTGNSGWTQLGPMIQQTGLGDMCLPSIPAPVDWAGKQGLVGVVCDSPDGILYQCAAVNFVNGTGTAPTSCTNASITATTTVDPKLTAMVGSVADTNGTSSSASSTGSASASAAISAAASASSSHSASPGAMAPSIGGWAGLGVALVAALFGAGLML